MEINSTFFASPAVKAVPSPLPVCLPSDTETIRVHLCMLWSCYRMNPTRIQYSDFISLLLANKEPKTNSKWSPTKPFVIVDDLKPAEGRPWSTPQDRT